MNTQQVTDALAPLLPGLAADGFLLNVKEVNPSGIVVELARTPDACESCIMPLESLEYLVAECLRKADAESPAVRVIERAP